VLLMVGARTHDIALDVAYHASPEPQLLDVHAVYAGEAELPLAAWAIGTLVECVTRGLGGGAELAPSAGSAKIISGPTGEGAPAPGEIGPDLRWQLEVTAMSPRFLRAFVEYLATSGRPHALVSLSIVGTAKPSTDARMTVRDAGLRRWLDDPIAYAEAWPTPGFNLTRAIAPRGATVSVELARAPSKEISMELQRTISAWQSAILTMPNLTKKARGFMDPQCRFAETRTSIVARAELFDHARVPSTAALSNALAWFHTKVAPIAKAEIALP
jgi:hypothetical protein